MGKALRNIVQVRPYDGKIIKIWDTLRDAEEQGGYSIPSMLSSIRGDNLTHENYMWLHINKIVSKNSNGRVTYVHVYRDYFGNFYVQPYICPRMCIPNLIINNPYTKLPELEQWKQISLSCHDYYYISNFGRVKKIILDENNQIVLESICKNHYYDRYMKVSLGSTINKRKMISIRTHRLVAMAFLPNPNNYPIINHKDEITTNNCYWNLEWCTHHYNVTYNNIHRRKKCRTREVKVYDLDRKLINKFNSIIDASIYFNISKKAMEYHLDKGEIFKNKYYLKRGKLTISHRSKLIN